MIPQNPLTIALNGWIMDQTIKKLNDDYLPNYEIIETSAYRNPDKNRDVGGVEDSAHMYNLARDIVLKNIATGKVISDSELKNVYEQFIKPHWNGFSYFKPKQSYTNTGWLHLNLNRNITDATKWAAWAATAGGLAWGARKLFLTMKGRA